MPITCRKRLLGLNLAGIARVMQVSEDWLQGHTTRCHEAVPHRVQVQAKDKGHLEVRQ